MHILLQEGWVMISLLICWRLKLWLAKDLFYLILRMKWQSLSTPAVNTLNKSFLLIILHTYFFQHKYKAKSKLWNLPQSSAWHTICNVSKYLWQTYWVFKLKKMSPRYILLWFSEVKSPNIHRSSTQSMKENWQNRSATATWIYHIYWR